VPPGFGIACIAAVQRAEVERMIRGTEDNRYATGMPPDPGGL
jgi:hypothetical protein